MNELLLTILGGSGASLLNFGATKIYNLATGKKKNFLWKDNSPTFLSLGFNNDLEALKRRAKILVVDDEDTFPVKLFQDAGYNLEKWELVKDIAKLERGDYDIIILDIMDVAKHISVDDGLGVLEIIKHYNPSQIVVAYSGHSFDLSKTRFWELADEKIAKPSDFLKIRMTIDNLIINKYNPERYISTLNRLLRDNNISEVDIRKYNSDLIRIIRKKTVPQWNSIIHFAKPNTPLYNKAFAISNTLLKFYS